MPTNRTRRQRKSNQLFVPRALEYYFETGSQDQSGFPECDRYNEWIFFNAGRGKDLIDFWRVCRERLLSSWVKKHPCSRPFYWWGEEAPEPRQRVGGKGQSEGELYQRMESYFFGIPDCWEKIDPDDPPVFESEASYLFRHGLLTASEKKWLAIHPEALEAMIFITEEE